MKSCVANMSKKHAVHKSEKAKLVIRKLGTLGSDRLLSKTVRTQIFPNKLVKPITQTQIRNHVYPMISSHGLNAFGEGEQATTLFLKHQ